MEKQKRSLKIISALILSLSVLTIVMLSSLAYFNFKKVYEGTGNLPVLNINYTVKDNVSSLKNIVYNGQQTEDVEVKINTIGNNINGLVRIKIGYVWSGSLSNTAYVEGTLINACSINYDDSLWQQKQNGYFYLNAPMQPGQEIMLFNQIKFENLTDNYRGKKVDIYIICEIYQTTNLPENWE